MTVENSLVNGTEKLSIFLKVWKRLKEILNGPFLKWLKQHALKNWLNPGLVKFSNTYFPFLKMFWVIFSYNVFQSPIPIISAKYNDLLFLFFRLSKNILFPCTWSFSTIFFLIIVFLKNSRLFLHLNFYLLLVV